MERWDTACRGFRTSGCSKDRRLDVAQKEPSYAQSSSRPDRSVASCAYDRNNATEDCSWSDDREGHLSRRGIAAFWLKVFDG